MTQQRRMSGAGRAMTKSFEGLRLNAYEDCAGVWTIGYGHTGADVIPNRTITEAEAEALLTDDLGAAEACVCKAVTVEITQGQFDALVDFCFNLGERRLLSSTLLRYVNAGNFIAAANQFGMWVHAAGRVQPGLVKRRQAEAEMFTRSIASCAGGNAAGG